MSRSQENKIKMLNWNEYRKDLMATIKKIAGISPDVVQGYQTITGAGAKTNKLNEKTRQLISLAVAVTTKCDGCITVHTDLAIKAGATREEIVEALGVAVAMNAGAALVYSARVIDAFEQRSAASA